LITLIHEISHLVAFEKFGRNIKPHGNEWKYSFQRLMIIYAQKFSKSAATFIGKTFQNPTASSDTDTTLSLALKQFDAQNDKNYIFEIPMGVQDR
jgi:predicted SprT family Zn-dependent metalloprotease